MGSIYRSDKIEKKYYVQKKKDFERILELMKYMPSFSMQPKEGEVFTDLYYETEDNFLHEMGVTVRLRILKDRQIISVKYTEELLSKQNTIYKTPIHDHVIDLKESIKDPSNLLFIEDKLNVIFGGKLQIDILRKLRHMTIAYEIKTKRQTHEVVHNSGFRAFVHFDDVIYINKTKDISYTDLIIENHMTSPATDLNMQLLNKFVNELRRKVILVPMEESKYEAAILFTRFDK